MKILYISNDPGIPLYGRKGCSTHVRETCYSLSNAGHEVIVSIPEIGDDKLARPVNYVVPPFFKSKKLGFDLRLYLNNYPQWFFFKSLIKKFKPEAIYERYSLYSWVGDSIERKFRLPRIVEINAPMAMQHKDRLRFPSYAQKIEEKIMRNSEAVIAVSEPLKEYLKELGVDKSKITVMPIAVDPDLFKPDTSGDKIRKQYNLEDKTVYGYVGAFNYYHGIDNIYKLAGHFKKNDMKAVLFIVGGEDYKVEKHKQKIIDANLDNYIIFAGSVSYEILPQYIAAMDIAMIFGHKHYASPTKLFEYASMEKPIIAPDFPPIRAVLDRGRDSENFIFKPDSDESLIEKADFLYNYPEKRHVLVKKIKDSVLLEHTWESNTLKVIEIFEKLKSLPKYKR